MQCKKIKRIHVHDLITNSHFDWTPEEMRQKLYDTFPQAENDVYASCDAIADFYNHEHDAHNSSSYDAWENDIAAHEHFLGIFTYEN